MGVVSDSLRILIWLNRMEGVVLIKKRSLLGAIELVGVGGVRVQFDNSLNYQVYFSSLVR